MGSEDGISQHPDPTVASNNLIREETKNDRDEVSSDPLATRMENKTDDFDSNLPKTVTLLHGPNGAKLYLIGTAHFSHESQEDVSKVIRTVKPHIIVVELCSARRSILRLDEKTIQQEVCNMSFAKMRDIIKENGLVQGLMNIILLQVSAQLTRDLGMAPGGEFRRAFEECKQLPGCILHYGDRPIHITLKRALAVLSWWQKLSLACALLFQNEKFTKDDVEQFKESDLLVSLLKKMSSEYPGIGQVFIEERDIYLTFSLQNAVISPFYNENDQREPTVAVGVVGIGHTPGIKNLWMTVSDKDVVPILKIEEKKSHSNLLKKSIGICLFLFVGYKLRHRLKLHSAFNHIMAYIK